MSTKCQWILPAYFSTEDRKTDPIRLDLTSNIRTFLSNQVWNRKVDYGSSDLLKSIDQSDIINISATLFPRFSSGSVNIKRLQNLIAQNCIQIPTHLGLKSYKEWPYSIGMIILESEFKASTDNIPTKNDLRAPVPQYEPDFIEHYHLLLGILRETSAFLLAGLHLTFPTHSIIMSSDKPIIDGMFLIESDGKAYGSRVASNAFMHEIHIEKTKYGMLTSNVNILAEVWHLELWPLQRYLKAVESDILSIDNLLDLLYALEGMFEKNASTDFIKLMCIVCLCNSRKESNRMRPIIDLAFKMRNRIVHEGHSYGLFETVLLWNQESLAQDIYWEMKGIVASMIVMAISKMRSRAGMTNLRFTVDDFLTLYFKT